jgi:hypothetical protein
MAGTSLHNVMARILRLETAQKKGVCLAMSPSAFPFNELRSYAGDLNRPRMSPISLHPSHRHRARMLSRALAVAQTLLAIFASRADLIREDLAPRQRLAVLRR